MAEAQVLDVLVGRAERGFEKERSQVVRAELCGLHQSCQRIVFHEVLLRPSQCFFDAGMNFCGPVARGVGRCVLKKSRQHDLQRRFEMESAPFVRRSAKDARDACIGGALLLLFLRRKAAEQQGADFFIRIVKLAPCDRAAFTLGRGPDSSHPGWDEELGARSQSLRFAVDCIAKLSFKDENEPVRGDDLIPGAFAFRKETPVDIADRQLVSQTVRRDGSE